MYTIRRLANQLWQTGFYDLDGNWITSTTTNSQQLALDRAQRLNAPLTEAFLETLAVVGPTGAQGPQGPQGPAGPGISSAYLVDASSSAAAWTAQTGSMDIPQGPFLPIPDINGSPAWSNGPYTITLDGAYNAIYPSNNLTGDPILQGQLPTPGSPQTWSYGDETLEATVSCLQLS